MATAIGRLVAGIWLLSLAHLVTGLAGPEMTTAYPPTAEPNTRDCTVNDHLPCTLYMFQGIDCNPFVNLKALFPELYSGGPGPGQPSSFTARVFPVDMGLQKRMPFVNFTFGPPKDVGIQSVHGFELMVYNPSNLPSCIILDLRNATWRGTEDYETSFTVGPVELVPGLPHDATLHSLPRDSESVPWHVPPTSYPDKVVAMDWMINITSVTVNPSTKTVEITFTQPPKEFHFEEFEVELRNKSNGVVQRRITDSFGYNFTGVEPGTYKVTVKAYDPYYGTMNVSVCKCPNVSMSHCWPCRTTRSELFNVTEDPLEYDVVKTTTSATTTMLYWLPVASVIMIVSLIVVILVLCRRSKRSAVGLCVQHSNKGDNRSQRKGTDFAETDSVITVIQFMKHKKEHRNKPMMVRKKLFIVYEETNDSKLVDVFASYLQNHCFCDVMCAPWNLDSDWVLEALQKANFLIIVNSETAIHRLKLTDLKSRENDVCMLTKLIQQHEFTSKVLAIRFQRTVEDCMKQPALAFPSFTLIRDFLGFLSHVHGISSDQARRCLSHPAQLYESREGRMLVEWLEQSTNTSNTCKVSQRTTGSDSGIGACSGSEGSLKSHTSQTKSIERQLLTYLEGSSDDVLTIRDVCDYGGNVTANKNNNNNNNNNRSNNSNVESTAKAPCRPEIRHEDEPEQCFGHDYSRHHSDFFCIPPDDFYEYDDDDVSQTVSSQMQRINERYMQYSSANA